MISKPSASELAESSVPAAPDEPARRAKPARRRSYLALLLVLILLAQIAVTLWVMHSNRGMFEDEGTYSYDGHEEWASWFGGVPNTSDYPKILSGAPVFYPVIAAGLDTLGGLLAIRLFSLAMMLIATITLFYFTKRLYGPRAAVIGAALFALLQPTAYMGALGTYDAMALALLGLGSLCALRAAQSSRRALPWIAGAVVLCMLADAAKYASLLWNAPVFAVLLFASVPAVGWRRAWIRTLGAAIGLGLLIGGALYAGGSDYRSGIAFTTTQRSSGTTPPSEIYHDTLMRLGLVLVLALLGLAFAMFAPAFEKYRVSASLLAGSLIVAGLLAPINQARIRTDTAFPKHLGFGAWFTAALAGFGIAAFFERTPSRVLANAVTGLAVLASGLYGASQARMLFDTWGNAVPAVDAMQPYISKGTARYLAEDDPVEQYYLRNETNQSQWYNTWFFSYQDPKTKAQLSGTPAYVDAIKHDYFSVVELLAVDTEAADQQMAQQLDHTEGYSLIAKVPYYEYGSSKPFSYYDIWVLNKKK